MAIFTNLKEQPDNQKKLFSLITAIILTLVIVFVWFSFTDKPADGQDVIAEEDKLSSISPLQMIKDEFSKAMSNFNSAVSETETGSSTLSDNTVPIEIIDATTTATSTEESI